MSNAARNHKDNVFCLLYRDKKNLLSLYNAMNGTNYEKEEELEVVTLEEAICMKMRNDAAFVIDSTLNLYEQQASVNPNMPLRDLYYVTEELKKIAPPGRLHRTTRVTIPAPRFVVFYNGTAEQSERETCRLSDLFSGEEKEPNLELVVTTININPGCNGELLEKCESLQGYMVFVGKVRDKRGAGVKLEEAVRQAVNECISENVLTVFFKKNKEEIVEMGVYVMTHHRCGAETLVFTGFPRFYIPLFYPMPTLCRHFRHFPALWMLYFSVCFLPTLRESCASRFALFRA